MEPTKTQRLAAAGTVVLIAEPLLAMAHTGALGMIVGGAAGVATYLFADDIARALTKDAKEGEQSPSSQASIKEVKPKAASGEQGKKPSLAYRLLNGRSVREGADGPQVQEEAAIPAKSSTKQASRGQEPVLWIPPQFKLDDTLDLIRELNGRGYIYFGESEQGAIALPLADMYHVIDISSSGKGKSNRFRLALMQMTRMCETYLINPVSAEVKPVTDSREIEVWKPLFDGLSNKRPVKEGKKILSLMTTLAAEIDRRNALEEERDFTWQKRPVFLFIDELPEVFARCPEAIELLDKIGRMGRQFRVFCWVAAQTAQVKETGLSTAAQAQFMTRIYGGGDRTSAERMMKGSLPSNTERTLQSNGAGLTLMLGSGMGDCSFTRAPLITDEAMFSFLELPEFNKEEWMGKKTAELAPPLVEQHATFPTFPVLPDVVSPAQHPDLLAEEKGKGKREKVPREEDILDAMDALEEEGKVLTLHAIAKRGGFTRHQYDDIEEVAVHYGYELERGKGRPKENQ